MILDGGGFEGLKWIKKLNGFVAIRCVSKVDILGHEHWHSRKEEDGVFIQTHVI